MLVVLEMLSWLFTCPFSAPKKIRPLYFVLKFLCPKLFCQLASCEFLQTRSPKGMLEGGRRREGTSLLVLLFLSASLPQWLWLQPPSSFRTPRASLTRRLSCASGVLSTSSSRSLSGSPGHQYQQGSIPSSGLCLSSTRPLLYTARFCHLQPLPFCFADPGVVAAFWVAILAFS